MEINLFFKGLILGFSIAAPVGPIGILCIRRTLQFGRFSGFFSGLGAATADVIYALIAAFGLTFISDILIAGQFWLRLIGGAFLLYLGGRVFFTIPSARTEQTRQTRQISHTTFLSDFTSTFLLTAANPMTILSFLAIFAGLGVSNAQGDYVQTSLLVLGVFLGSAAWWILLSEGVTLFRKRVSQKMMLWINRIAGLLIVGFGATILLTLIVPF
jgi:threonine/homoserine/homoserine lactone efflux protein